jgi:hypothetical protein
MNNVLIIDLYFFKEVNRFIKEIKTDESGDEQNECQHCFTICAAGNANGMPVFLHQAANTTKS